MNLVTNNSRSSAAYFLQLLILTVLVLTVGGAKATPKAGSIIGNQASATYTDADGTQYSTTSNLVETVVQPVYGLSLAADQTSLSSAGNTVYFPHLISNTGNADDTYTLSASNDNGDDFDFSNLLIYKDEDRDGTPDTAQSVTSISVKMGGQVNLIVAATVPGLSSAGDSASLTLTATSDLDNSKSSTVTDTATLRNGAVVNVTKSMSTTSASADANVGVATPYTVTLAYQNTGNAAASNLTIIDTLPSGMHFVDDSGRASLTGSQTLTDDNTAEPGTSDGSTITFEYDNANHRVTFTVDSAANSGYVQFQVHVLATDTAGDPLNAGNIRNTATYAYDGQSAQATNDVVFTVLAETQVSLDTSGLDTKTLASAAQGSVASFSHTVSNSGNTPDTFNLSFSSSTFPAGTAFKLFRADGVTPLVDSNSDGIVDTGILEAAESFNIILKVYVPPNYTGGPVQITLSASSVLDSTVSDGVIDVITSITALSVDLTVNDTLAGGGDGSGNPGVGGEGSPVASTSVNAGSTSIVPLFINNQSSGNANFDISITNLPSGWELSFFKDANGNGSIDNGETLLINSDVIPGNTALAVLAKISTPSSASSGNQDLVFLVDNPSTSAADYLKYRVTVAETYAIEVTPNNIAQAAAGTSVVTTHRVLNVGNIASGDISLSVAHSNGQGWSSTIYLDDGTSAGAFDAGDSVYNPSTAPSLTVGSEFTIYVHSIAPLTATAGAQNTVTITASISPSSGDVSALATNVITVISTEIALSKTQALDADCDGAADASFTAQSLSSGAVPGACIIYRITAENSGSESVSALVIYDTTPRFTSLESANLDPGVTVGGATYTASGDCNTTSPGVTAPADEATGVVTGFICNLAAGASARLDFSVEIDL